MFFRPLRVANYGKLNVMGPTVSPRDVTARGAGENPPVEGSVVPSGQEASICGEQGPAW